VSASERQHSRSKTLGFADVHPNLRRAREREEQPPTLPCKQGRERTEGGQGAHLWQLALLLPLLAGGGWEGVRLLIFQWVSNLKS
jgi:hypothetical protein